MRVDRGSEVWRLALLGGALLLLLVAGFAFGTFLAGESSTESRPSTADGPLSEPSRPQPPRSIDAGVCDLSLGEPLVGGPTTELVELGEANGVRVEGAVYPRPDYEGDPWSQWGQGIALADGRFLSAIGDHIGPDGNSYIYEYDPATRTLATLGDLLSYIDHEPGSWGYGKVHGQMVVGPCGEVYFTSYWGTYRDIRFDGTYRGDILFRLDPELRTIAALGVPVVEHGVPSLAASGAAALVYGEAVDPFSKASDIDEGPFFVYDTDTEQVIFEGPSIPHSGYRNIMVDSEGRAYYSIGDGQLAVYDPGQNDITTHPSRMPGDWLRASTTVMPDGRVFGVTREPDMFFVLEPSGEMRSLGEARGYTTSMALHPDGDRFFYIPDAHGGAWVTGAPLISVDTGTGDQTVVAELNPLVEARLGLRLGGTYNIAVAPSGQTVFVGMNAGTLGSDDSFGEVVLLVVHLL